MQVRRWAVGIDVRMHRRRTSSSCEWELVNTFRLSSRACMVTARHPCDEYAVTLENGPNSDSLAGWRRACRSASSRKLCFFASVSIADMCSLLPLASTWLRDSSSQLHSTDGR